MAAFPSKQHSLWASLAISVLLMHCAEADYYQSCRKSLRDHVVHGDNNYLIWGPTEYSQVVRDLTYSILSDQDLASLFEKVSDGQPSLSQKEDDNDDDDTTLTMICHKTYQTIGADLLDIPPELSNHCVDYFSLYHQNGRRMNSAEFRSFLQFVGDQRQGHENYDDVSSNNIMHDFKWTPSTTALFTEYQESANSLHNNDNREMLDHLCWEVVVEGTLRSIQLQQEAFGTINNNHHQHQPVPAPTPSLSVPNSPRVRGSVSRRLQTVEEFRDCQTQLFISNDIVRDTFLWPKEFILFLNKRFNTTYTSDVLVADLPDPYRDAYRNSVPAGADYPVITGVIPGTENDATRQVLWDICQRADAAFAQVGTPVVPTAAPFPATTFAPVPIDMEPDAFFKSLCNVAIKLSQLSEDNLPGLTRQEYVRTLGIALKNDLTIADPFDGLSSCFQSIYFAYGVEPIPLLGTSANPIDEPTLGFCRAIYQTNLVPCIPPTSAPSPSVPTAPTIGMSPSSAPTISDIRFQLCLSQLDAADVAPQNDRISRTEFPSFINKLFFGAVPLVPYDDLSPQFRNVFDSYVSPTGEIITLGASNIDLASPLQVTFLRGLCRDAYDAPNALSPTSAPTAAPVEGGEDLPDCFQSLVDADSGDMDSILSEAEYLDYLRSLGITADSFDTLPYSLRDNFLWISDIRGEFNINGASSPAASQQMRELLTQSCERTDEVIRSTRNGNNEVLRDAHCFDAFTSADTDVDNRISQTEFVQFVNFFTGIEHAASFDILEPDFRRFFNENKDVNTDEIDVTGSKPGDNPSGVALAVLEFLCEGMETRVADVRSENIVLDKCSRTLDIANMNADGTLSDEEFAAFIYVLAGLAPDTSSFALLSPEAKSFFTNFAASLGTLDLVAWLNGGQLKELERIALVNNCNQAISFSDDFTPESNNVTTIFNSFVIINDSNLTASAFNSSTSTELRDLHRAYNSFVYSEVADSLNSSSRRLRGRRLLVLGVEEFSPDIYQIDDSDCPPDRSNSTCQTVYARFDLVHVNETDPDELKLRYQNLTQQAISDGDLQDALGQINPSSLIEILRANDQLTPDESPGSPPGTRSGGGDDDDKERLLFIIIGICGGVGICCCCLAAYICIRRRDPRSRMSKTGRDDKDTASYPGEMNMDDDDHNSSPGLGNFQTDDIGKDNGLGTFGSSTSDQGSESDEEGEEFGFQDEPNDMPEQSPFGNYDTKTSAFEDEYESEEYEEEEYSEESFEEESVSPEESEEESSGEYEETEPTFGADGQSPDGMFGSQSPQWQTEEESQDPGSNWGGQSPFASTFVTQDSPAQQEEASYYSAANSKKSAGSKKSAASKKSNQSSKGSGSGSSKVSEPPENAFENTFYDNTGQIEMEEVEIDDSDDDSSSYDSEVAGEKLKPPVEAQEEYGYEYDESMDDDEDEEEDSSEEDSEEEDEEEESEEDDSDEVEDSSDDSGGLTPAQKKQYRAVIEALVREVVPDEIEHVDSMMEQFVGREEELINTLRNMVTDDDDDSSSEYESDSDEDDDEDEDDNEEDSEESSEYEDDDDEDEDEYEEEVVEDDGEEEYSSGDSSYEEESVSS